MEWKIAQCKEFIEDSRIYISSNSDVIGNIAQSEDVNFIKRCKESSYSEMIVETLKNVQEATVIWTSSISPFLGSKDYRCMVNKYESEENICSLVAVHSRYDYVYFDDKRLNFSREFTPRNDLKPIRIVTNGCYVVKKDLAVERASLYDDAPFLYELDYLSSIEIKDTHTYKISKELISSYFQRDLDV